MDLAQIRKNECPWFVDLSKHDHSKHIEMYHLKELN